MKIKKYKLKLKSSKPQELNSSLAYKLYAVLCGKISGEYAQRLHEQKKYHPVSQRLYINHSDQTANWEVVLFNDACDEFGKALEEDSFYIKDNDMELTVILRETAEYTSEGIMELARLSEYAGGKTDIYFSTPTAFKQNGEYLIFPSVELLIKSAAEKWSALDERVALNDPDAVRMLISGIRITSYNLKSSYYRMKNVKIPAFTGKITLSAKLPPPLMEIYLLIIEFIALSGIGIKNTLGMGGVRIEKHQEKRRDFNV